MGGDERARARGTAETRGPGGAKRGVVAQQIAAEQGTTPGARAEPAPERGPARLEHDASDTMRDSHPSAPRWIDLPQVVQERGDQKVGVARPLYEKTTKHPRGVAPVGRGQALEGGQLWRSEQGGGESDIAVGHEG